MSVTEEFIKKEEFFSQINKYDNNVPISLLTISRSEALQSQQSFLSLWQ